MQTGKGSTVGRYELLSELGRGAMGIVYQARDPKIERLVGEHVHLNAMVQGHIFAVHQQEERSRWPEDQGSACGM